MAFSIGLIPDPVPDHVELDPGVVACLGVIQIGSFHERFLASLMYWSTDDYKRHWKLAIERIIHSSNISCLITSMIDPSTGTHIFWWPMYRVNENVFIQNQILFFDQLDSPFNELNPFSSVCARETINVNGDVISEWSVRIDEIEEFWIKEYSTQ